LNHRASLLNGCPDQPAGAFDRRRPIRGQRRTPAGWFCQMLANRRQRRRAALL